MNFQKILQITLIVAILYYGFTHMAFPENKNKAFIEQTGYTEEAFKKVQKKQNCFVGFDENGKEVHSCKMLEQN